MRSGFRPKLYCGRVAVWPCGRVGGSTGWPEWTLLQWTARAPHLQATIDQIQAPTSPPAYHLRSRVR